MESFWTVHDRKREVVDLLTGFLDNLGQAGEAAAEFCALYDRLIETEDHWQYYLAVKV